MGLADGMAFEKDFGKDIWKTTINKENKMTHADDMNKITRDFLLPFEKEREQYIEAKILEAAKNGFFQIEIKTGISVTNEIKTPCETHHTIKQSDISKLQDVGYRVEWNSNRDCYIIKWNKK